MRNKSEPVTAVYGRNYCTNILVKMCGVVSQAVKEIVTDYKSVRQK